MSTATKPASDCAAPDPCTCVGCAQAVTDRESPLDLGGSDRVGHRRECHGYGGPCDDCDDEVTA